MSWEEWLEIPSAFDRWVFEAHGPLHGNSAPLWGPAGPWLKMTNDALLYLQGHAHTHDHTCEHTGQVSVYIHMCTDRHTYALCRVHTHACMCITYPHRHKKMVCREQSIQVRRTVLNLWPHAWGIFLLGDGATWGHFAYLQPPTGVRNVNTSRA